MKYDVITIGDAFEDVFVNPELDVRYDRSFASGQGICFEFGEKIPLSDLNYEIGGTACNVAVGLSRLGYKASMVAVLGDDTPKDKIIDRLATEGVDDSNVIIKPDIKTSFSVIFSIKGERTIFVYHSLKDYSELKMKKNIKTKWFFIGPLGENTKELESRLVSEVAENGAMLAWNPGSKQIERGAQYYLHLLKNISVLFLNRGEAIKFLNYPVKPQIEEVMRALKIMGPKIVVVTNGKEGVKCYDGSEFYTLEAEKNINVVDSTGAGDAFASGFLSEVINHDFKEPLPAELIRSALKAGVMNSSSVIRQIGGQKGLLWKLVEK